MAPERVTQGSPTTRLAETVAGESFKSGLWEVTPGRFTTAPRGFDEVVHIISDSEVLRSEGGTAAELSPGVSFLMETGSWVSGRSACSSRSSTRHRPHSRSDRRGWSSTTTESVRWITQQQTDRPRYADFLSLRFVDRAHRIRQHSQCNE